MTEVLGDEFLAMRFRELIETDNDIHQLLGHALMLPEEEMAAQLVMEDNGLWYPEPPVYRNAIDICHEAGLIEQVYEWELLLTLEYDEKREWSWGKAGTLYFLIRQQDLRTGDFSRVRIHNHFV
jgi:hypothetical protein